MGKGKDLTAHEKSEIVRQVAAGTPSLAIAKQLRRDHRTVKKFLADASHERTRTEKAPFRSVSTRQLAMLKREVARAPLATSRTLFCSAGIAGASRPTRCRILRSIAVNRKACARPVLTRRHQQQRVQWAESNLKTDFRSVLFTDEMRATLDGPDGWASGWVPAAGWTPARMRRQQGGGGVMVWAGIVNNQIVGPFLIPDGVKVTASVYCDFLRDHFLPWHRSQKAAFRNKLVLMQDNAPSHAAHLTRDFLASHGFKNSRLMAWPANSPDLNPIENLWAIVKRRIYAEGRQFQSKQQLWDAIRVEMGRVSPQQVMKLTASMDDRLLKVLRLKGRHIAM